MIEFMRGGRRRSDRSDAGVGQDGVELRRVAVTDEELPVGSLVAVHQEISDLLDDSRWRGAWWCCGFAEACSMTVRTWTWCVGR